VSQATATDARILSAVTLQALHVTLLFQSKPNKRYK